MAPSARCSQPAEAQRALRRCAHCACAPPLSATAAALGDGTRDGQEGDLDSRAAAAGAPGHFFCPISLQIMRDPVVVAATGQT